MYTKTNHKDMKKYKLKSFKTHKNYTKDGRYFHEPLFFDTKIEAYDKAEEFLLKHKCYAVVLYKENPDLMYYDRMITLTQPKKDLKKY